MASDWACLACFCCPSRPRCLQLNFVPQGVRDMTAREDLLVHLRQHLLLQLARGMGCTKIARGDCAGTVAVHVLAETAKVVVALHGYQPEQCQDDDQDSTLSMDLTLF
eukprot:scaffold224533_cov21-Tisochrysis_lutea.AAC.2